MPRSRYLIPALLAVAVALPAAAAAQRRTLAVISSDSQPIVYAYVTVNGGSGQITDAKGEINLGTGKAKTLTVNVRRIGYQPWFGQIAFPDTAATLHVTLGRIAQELATVSISGSESRAGVSLLMKGFYDRWEMRQKGLLSATFIGPEELEFRHPDKITNMLFGLNGVRVFKNYKTGQLVVTSTQIVDLKHPLCPMAIVIDGHQVYGGAIDDMLSADDVTAIEIYSRGGNMPVSMQVQDAACGAIAFWTGSRKP
jgi:hypothetical protein